LDVIIVADRNNRMAANCILRWAGERYHSVILRGAYRVKDGKAKDYGKLRR
jgi:hypothetical protein